MIAMIAMNVEFTAKKIATFPLFADGLVTNL